MYRKCQNSWQESRAPFRTWQYSGGTGKSRRRTSECSTTLHCSSLRSLLCLPSAVWIFSLNQLYCSVQIQLWEALSCLFIEQAANSPLPSAACTTVHSLSFDVGGCCWSGTTGSHWQCSTQHHSEQQWAVPSPAAYSANSRALPPACIRTAFVSLPYLGFYSKMPHTYYMPFPKWVCMYALIHLLQFFFNPTSKITVNDPYCHLCLRSRFDIALKCNLCIRIHYLDDDVQSVCIYNLH